MDQMSEQFDYLFNDCVNNGLTLEAIHTLCVEHIRNPEAKKEFKQKHFDKKGTWVDEISSKSGNTKSGRIRRCCLILVYTAIAVLAVGILSLSAFCVIYGVDALAQAIVSSPCLIDHNEISLEVTRPLYNCSICEKLSAIPVEQNLSQERFERLYAYTTVPVVVKGTGHNWASTRERFTFEFFKRLYQEQEGALDMVEESCQFFPYNSGYKTLGHVFNMSKEKSEMKQEHWYVGWSNCVPKIETELRRHYKKPEFLPERSYSTHLDWIFMGGWGYGAPMHLDNVERPSWQAQLSGRKTWILSPSAECGSRCHPLQVTVDTGDIIIVDTNVWYHSTYVHPGDISITIGAEYD